jgi:hypothetical protein
LKNTQILTAFRAVTEDEVALAEGNVGLELVCEINEIVLRSISVTATYAFTLVMPEVCEDLPSKTSVR